MADLYAKIIGTASNYLYSYVLIILLVGGGIYFTIRTTTSLRMMRNAPSARQTSPEMRVSWLWNTPRSTTKYRTSCTAAQASTTPPSA